MAVHKRKRSPYWYFDFTVRGRRFRGSTEAADRETAQIIEAKLRHDALLGAVTGRRPRMTLDDAFGRYWLDHAHRLPSARVIAYQSRSLLAGLGKDTRLDEITDNAVAVYVARARARVGDSTVNRHLTLLKAVLRMARDRWGVEVAMPNFKAHWLREPEPRTRYLTPAEAQRLLDCAADHLRPAIEFSLLTGVRFDNCVSLDWSQIDMRAREIAMMIKSRSPGGKPHVVPMAEPVFVLLANLGPRDHGPVFTYKGRRVTTFKCAFRAACRRAGIEDFRWHDLRHTAASWMVQAGVPLDVVRQVLGHRSIATTMRYAHRDTHAKRQAVEAAASHWRHTASPDDTQQADFTRKN